MKKENFNCIPVFNSKLETLSNTSENRVETLFKNGKCILTPRGIILLEDKERLVASKYIIEDTNFICCSSLSSNDLTKHHIVPQLFLKNNPFKMSYNHNVVVLLNEKIHNDYTVKEKKVIGKILEIDLQKLSSKKNQKSDLVKSLLKEKFSSYEEMECFFLNFFLRNTEIKYYPGVLKQLIFKHKQVPFKIERPSYSFEDLEEKPLQLFGEIYNSENSSTVSLSNIKVIYSNLVIDKSTIKGTLSFTDEDYFELFFLNKIDFKIRAWCRKEEEVVKILELVAIDLD